MIGLAYAMAPPPEGAEGGGLIAILPPMIMMFLIFYFILIRPQQKKQREQRQMIDNLKDGDQVVTTGGIHGTIKKLKDDVITLQIADNCRIKIDKQYISKLKGGSKNN